VSTVSKHHTLSAAWLKRAQAHVNADPSFRKRGSVDLAMIVKVGRDAYLVSFSGFSCQKVAKVTAHEMRDTDVVVTMSPELWTRFLEGRRDGTGRTLIELDATDAVVSATNPRKKLDFQRYHTSVQAFFDAGVSADTQATA
jgi:hypothetical protein